MIHDLQQAKNAHTGHFFDQEAVKLFKCRFYKFYPVEGGAYFITSEQGFFGEDRLYSVRFIRDSGRITTRFFRNFGTKKNAESICRKLQRVANALSGDMGLEYDGAR